MSFKLNKCLLLLDTEEMKMNGVLIPVFYLLNNSRKNIWINFIGENQIILEVENNLAHMG